MSVAQPSPAQTPAPTPAQAPAQATAPTTVRQIVSRGVVVSPELARGLGLTIGLAGLATLGRVVVPMTVQQAVDRGLKTDANANPGFVATMAMVALVGVVLTAGASYLTNVRIFRSSEAGLRTLRVRAFERIHALDMLTLADYRRGVLVARVTTDVDTISNFVQWGGLILFVSAAQIVVATVIMAVYSWPLTLVVWAFFIPLLWLLPRMQAFVSLAYVAVRERVADMLSAVAETVSGAITIRSFGIQARTQAKVDRAVSAHASAASRAQVMVALSFTGGFLVSSLVVALVVGVGMTFGLAHGLTLGRLLAFLFLVNLFTTPVQMGTESLNQMQDALAGWRRVLAIIDAPILVADPGPEGITQERGPGALSLTGVNLVYPDGRTALREIDLTLPAGRRIAIVGETGSGKTTLARLITRLIDPTTGVVKLDGADLRTLSTTGLRARVVLVPQEVYLLDASLEANIIFGHGEASSGDVRKVLAELGLESWADALPHGLETSLGSTGQALSAGERQYVALARAHLADPDVLVLDEATSAVDPAAELRLQDALDSVLRDRTSVAIAHRLSTAERADLVVVVDAGRVVDVGTHPELLNRCGVYQGLHRSWATGSHGE